MNCEIIGVALCFCNINDITKRAYRKIMKLRDNEKEQKSKIMQLRDNEKSKRAKSVRACWG